MDLEIVIPSEVKSDRERQITYDITYNWNLKNGTNEPVCRAEIRDTDVENKGMDTKRGEWRGMGGGVMN